MTSSNAHTALLFARPAYQPLLFRRDAGAHRVWAAYTHGSLLRFGGGHEQWRRACRTVAALAGQTGQTVAAVRRDLAADHMALERAGLV